MKRIPPTKEEIIGKIKALGGELGRAPTQAQFWLRTGLHQYHVTAHFVKWSDAILAAGLIPFRGNLAVSDEQLLMDWGEVARLAGCAPTSIFYKHHGKHCNTVLSRRFGRWSEIPRRFRQFAVGRAEWADVLLILDSTEGQPPYARRGYLPVNSKPMELGPLNREPANEQGVVLLFGMLAEKLGFKVDVIQSIFPDCQAQRRGPDGQWRPVRIEFEYESRNFRDHGHSPDGCDLIICWKHNWPECPASLEVIELAALVKAALPAEVAAAQADELAVASD